MANERMEQNWIRVKEQIQDMWGEFDEKDLKKARGNLRRMVSLIHEKTGEDENDILEKMGAII